MTNMKKYVAEFIGTMLLVVFGCGVAVATGCMGPEGVVATALAFGLVIVALAYSVGNVSGCHVNPAVSIAMLISKKITLKDFFGYIIAQFLGATAGAGILGLFFGRFEVLGGNAAQSILLRNYGETGALIVALIVEIVLTFAFVFAILGVTSKTENNAVSGVVIGLSLTLVHLLGIYLTGTSVNPARSFGPALLQALAGNTVALSQLWIFIVGPLVGGAVAALVHKLLSSKE